MWSGPRTVSTVADAGLGEPARTGGRGRAAVRFLPGTHRESAHPGRDEVIASQPVPLADRDPRADHGAPAEGRSVFYYGKQHDPPPAAGGRTGTRSRRCGTRSSSRDPRETAGLLREGAGHATLDDLGVWQQAEILTSFGGPVIDSRDLLDTPRGGAARAVRGAGRPVHAGHALLAAGPAGDRRRSGHHTGTTRSGGRPASARTTRGTRPCRLGWPRWPTSAKPFYQRLRASRLTGRASARAPHPTPLPMIRHPTPRPRILPPPRSLLVLQTFDERNRDLFVQRGRRAVAPDQAAISPSIPLCRAATRCLEGLRLYQVPDLPAR